MVVYVLARNCRMALRWPAVSPRLSQKTSFLHGDAQFQYHMLKDYLFNTVLPLFLGEGQLTIFV